MQLEADSSHGGHFYRPRVVRGFLWDGYGRRAHTDHHTTVRLYYFRVLRGKPPRLHPPPVSDADTGATVLFRLRSANGTEVTPTL
ncbi:hypothetical protein QBZ16_002550 [Prototheca wickerhamii]|uniref:Uncharacterized protein n=1 Tax=Prototheca wickerhamii TaxID=3111 RepID=A0AAD9IEG7_PROWI|nr:hypothetical protein QBZ16_002550 [Prototheca wickerhamii]